ARRWSGSLGGRVLLFDPLLDVVLEGDDAAVQLPELRGGGTDGAVVAEGGDWHAESVCDFLQREDLAGHRSGPSCSWVCGGVGPALVLRPVNLPIAKLTTSIMVTRKTEGSTFRHGSGAGRVLGMDQEQIDQDAGATIRPLRTEKAMTKA